MKIAKSIFKIKKINSANPDTVMEVSNKRNLIKHEFETKLVSGIDRYLNLVVQRVQHILSNEQRKSDFKPDISASNSDVMIGNPPSLVSFTIIKIYQII